MTKRIAIVGSRDFPYPEMVRTFVAELGGSDVEIVSGGAKGVDTIAEQLARAINLPVTVFHADWDTYGKAAGIIRNTKIVHYCDELYAFQYANSRGTANTIGQAKKVGKLREVVHVTRFG